MNELVVIIIRIDFLAFDCNEIETKILEIFSQWNNSLVTLGKDFIVELDIVSGVAQPLILPDSQFTFLCHYCSNKIHCSYSNVVHLYRRSIVEIVRREDEREDRLILGVVPVAPARLIIHWTMLANRGHSRLTSRQIIYPSDLCRYCTIYNANNHRRSQVCFFCRSATCTLETAGAR